METKSGMQVCTCPTCGGIIGEAAPIADVIQSIQSPISRTIVETLARYPGRAVSREALIAKLYSDREDGGPENAEKTVTTIVHNLRVKLERFGWTITKSKPGRGGSSLWRLIPTVAGAV